MLEAGFIVSRFLLHGDPNSFRDIALPTLHLSGINSRYARTRVPSAARDHLVGRFSRVA